MMDSAVAGGTIYRSPLPRDLYPYTVVRYIPLDAQWYFLRNHAPYPGWYRAYIHPPHPRHPCPCHLHLRLSPPPAVCPSAAASTPAPTPCCSCDHQRWQLPSSLLISGHRLSHRLWPWPTTDCPLQACQCLYLGGPSPTGGLLGGWGFVVWVYQSVTPPYVGCIKLTCLGNPCAGCYNNLVARIIM